MPNHVMNVLEFSGDAGKIREMREKIKNDKFGLGSIDFEKIIPMPENIYRGSIGNEEMKQYGENNWYDWSLGNRGTKWNAYGYEDNVSYSSDYPITFFTAWSAPHPVIEQLAKMYPDITFTHKWADEDIGINCGEYEYADGERIYITYTISETDVPLRYVVPAEQTTTVTVGRASVVNYDNTPKKGNIKINKQSEDGKNSGRTFKVVGNGKTYTAETDDNGVAWFRDLPVYDTNDKPIEYTISEKNVPLRYVTPADQKTTLTVDATVEKTFNNKLKKGNIKINKQSDDGYNGDRTFEVSGNGKTYTAKTDSNGIALFEKVQSSRCTARLCHPL